MTWAKPRRMSEDAAKKAAGYAAAGFVKSGMRVGLGTGSTAFFAVQAVGEAWLAGALRDLVVVATSERTAAQSRGYNLPLKDLSEVGALDITIDGADEVDDHLTLIKGAGGALLREKIVACASTEMVVVVDPSKLVQRLGSRYPVPVEVEPFGWQVTLRQLGTLGCEPVLRLNADGTPYRTDGGHYTVDCRFAEIPDAAALETSIKAFPGALECGLFVGIAKRVVVGEPTGTRVIG